MRGARMLNIVSRSLSDVGRRPSHDGVCKRRPLYRPAITRTLAHFDEAELFVPPLLHELQELTRQPTFVDERARFAMRGFHDVAVAHQVTGSQLRQA